MFDAHTHYHDKAFDTDREEILRALKSAGINMVFEAGEDLCGSRAALEMAKRFKGDEFPVINIAAGLHPLFIDDDTDKALAGLEELLNENDIAAIGECGLDYRGIKDTAVRNVQKKVFEEQLKLCVRYRLPAVVHSVDAAEDTLRLIRAYPEVTGLMHGFAYSAEIAKQYVSLGWKIGIGAVITRPDAVKIKKVAATVPAGSILAETDAPYISPFGKCGRSDSRDVFEIINTINMVREEAGAEKICQKREN